jgi:hypothetical protein
MRGIRKKEIGARRAELGGFLDNARACVNVRRKN